MSTVGDDYPVQQAPEAFRGAITGCMHYLRDAVEALAREVRK